MIATPCRPDASRIIDKTTGASWSVREAAQIMFATKEPNMRRPNRHPLLARDQMPSNGMGASFDQEPGEAGGATGQRR